jgi:hypothetical protein
MKTQPRELLDSTTELNKHLAMIQPWGIQTRCHARLFHVSHGSGSWPRSAYASVVGQQFHKKRLDKWQGLSVVYFLPSLELKMVEVLVGHLDQLSFRHLPYTSIVSKGRLMSTIEHRDSSAILIEGS